MTAARLSHVVGFDDGPFLRTHQGTVVLVGAVYAGLRLEGVLQGRVMRDGSDAADCMARLIAASKFAPQVQLIMLQGIAVAGFNVVDVFSLYQQLQLPVLVVARRQPDMPAIRRALEAHVPDGAAKWAVIEQLGPMEARGPVWIQRVGLSRARAETVLDRFAVSSNIPEPLRTAHLIAGAFGQGQGRGRV